MKRLLLCALLLSLSPASKAQGSGEEYELKPGEQYGYIVTSKGEKIEGIVKLAGTPQTPWVNQKKVRFIDKATIDPNRKRQRFTLLDTDDLTEYVAYDSMQERRFRLVKYANTREGLMHQGGDGAGSRFKTIKNLSATRHMAEVIVDGKITLYRLYGYPAAFAVGKGDVERAEADERNIIDHPALLVQKADSKVKTFKAEDVKNLVSDCPAVAEKLSSGAYAAYDPAKQEKKKSGMGKLLKNEADRVGAGLEKMGVEVFSDYNVICR